MSGMRYVCPPSPHGGELTRPPLLRHTSIRTSRNAARKELPVRCIHAHHCITSSQSELLYGARAMSEQLTWRPHACICAYTTISCSVYGPNHQQDRRRLMSIQKHWYKTIDFTNQHTVYTILSLGIMSITTQFEQICTTGDSHTHTHTHTRMHPRVLEAKITSGSSACRRW